MTGGTQERRKKRKGSSLLFKGSSGDTLFNSPGFVAVKTAPSVNDSEAGWGRLTRGVLRNSFYSLFALLRHQLHQPEQGVTVVFGKSPFEKFQSVRLNLFRNTNNTV